MMSNPAQPGGRKPAPALLSSVQDFVNTANLETDAEPFDLATVREWAARRGIRDDAVLDDLVRIREALRDWIAAGGAIPLALGDALRTADIRVTPGGDKLRLSSATSLGSALAPLVEAIQVAMADGTWSRLKSCERKVCRWVFYDHSKNATSHWCSTAVCGAREKARRARARAAGAANAGR